VEDDGEMEEVEEHCEQKTEYKLNRQRNIKDLQRRLHDLKETYLISGNLRPKQVKKSALKRKGIEEPAVKWVSKRNKDNK
jgi:hypothetical protein